MHTLAIRLAVCAASALAAARGATLYVDPLAPGPDRDGRAWRSAYPRIGQALAAAAPGDEIHVADGAYEETLTLTQGVALRGGFAGWSDPGARDPDRFVSMLMGQGMAPLVSAPPGTGASAVLEGFSLTTDGIAVYCAGASPTILRNTFLTADAGVQCGAGGAPRLWNNAFLDCDTGVSAHGTAVEAAGNLFVSNAVAIQIAEAGGALVNNTITWCGVGVSLLRASPDVENTILADNEIGMRAVSSAPALRHNLVFDNGADYDGTEDPTGRDGNLRADPRFVNAPANDYRLLADSPAVNAGRTKSALTEYDRDGNPRVMGGVVDIGAYEYAFAPPPSPADALAIAGGLRAATPEDAARLDVESAPPSLGNTDILDALRHARNA